MLRYCTWWLVLLGSSIHNMSIWPFAHNAILDSTNRSDLGWVELFRSNPRDVQATSYKNLVNKIEKLGNQTYNWSNNNTQELSNKEASMYYHSRFDIVTIATSFQRIWASMSGNNKLFAQQQDKDWNNIQHFLICKPPYMCKPSYSSL
jgi:hypothetical protein